MSAERPTTPLREPYRRRPDAANLPDTKTCGDCVRFRRCQALVGQIAGDEVCDWFPLRFSEGARP